MRASLTSRERVLRAIDHKEIDRFPRDFAAESPVIEGLRTLLGVPEGGGLGPKFETDFRYIGIPINCPYDDGRNIWGLTSTSASLTTTIANHPLGEATTVEEVDAHTWPNPDWADIEAYQKAAVEARKTDKVVVGSTWGSVFGEAYRLMGMDNFMMGLITYPEVVHRIVAHVTDFFAEVDRRAFESARGLVDMSFHGNDFGTQRGLFFRREQWLDFFSGPIKRLAGQAKRFGLRPMFHSCGAISQVIGDLADCGIEVLDPVQSTAEGMAPARLKKEFGDRLCFHGCISAQKVLPLGTPDDVRAHVREVCDIMKPTGYVFTSDQAITRDTPPENVLAMYEAVEEYGYC